MNRVLTKPVVRLLIIFFPLILIAGNVALIPGYTGDDSYIHFTYVRNLLERGILSYNTPTPTYGTTSFLWVLVCAACSAITGAIPLTAQILSGMLFFLSALLFARYLFVVARLTPGNALTGYVLYLANAVLFRWVLTGMEVGAALCVVVLFLNFWTTDHPYRSALLSIGAYLTRPEFLILPVMSALVVVVRGGDRRPPLRRHLIVTAIVFVGWFVAAKLYFGDLVPLTTMKSGSGPDAESIVRFVRVSLGMYPDLLLLASVAVGFRAFAWGKLRQLPEAEQILYLVTVGILGVYLLKGTSMISRYLLILHPVVVLFVVRCWTSPMLNRWFAPAVVVVLVVQLALFRLVHLEPVHSFVEGFQRVYTEAGILLERQSITDSGAVMVSDVGLIGYYSRRPVIDLVGLTSKEVASAGTRDDAVILARYHPQYAVIKLDTTSLEATAARWKSTVNDLTGMGILLHERIGALGVLSRPGQTFDVYVLKLQYQ